MRSLRLIPFTQVGAAAAISAAYLKPSTTSSLPLPLCNFSPSYNNNLFQSRRTIFGFSSSNTTATTPGAKDEMVAGKEPTEEEAKAYKKNKDGLMPEPTAEENAYRVNREKFVDVFLYDTINDYVNGKISSPKFVVYVMKTTLRAIKKNLEAELAQYKRDTEKIIAALQDEVERLRQRVRDLEARNRRLEEAAEEKKIE